MLAMSFVKRQDNGLETVSHVVRVLKQQKLQQVEAVAQVSCTRLLIIVTRVVFGAELARYY